ncbi:MAG TPA: zinc ribbon domain-containing protein [Tepidisphaeraceae bacterium]|nr:zinc ribbon domain-containing protein [Tepidisphaeraceae bacterium]
MWARVVVAVGVAVLCGCGNKTPPAEQPLVAIGDYAPPAQPAPRLRVAVPDLAVDDAKGMAPDVDLIAVGSDELVSLLDSSNRFDLTERNRLRQLLAAQGQADMIEPGRLVHPVATVQGFDYLLLGKITGLAATKAPPPDSVSISHFEQMTGVENYVPTLTVTAKVELWLVDARTGALAAVQKADFNHLGTPQSMGLQLTAAQLGPAPAAQLNPADTRHILRLVLDSALRPMLPRIDRFAAGRQLPSDSLANSVSNVTTQPATQPAPPSAPAAFVICPECGARVSADLEFCPNCGHKLK